MPHPRRNIITASLRGDATAVVRVAERVPVRGDRWMICSDGVSDYQPDDAIADVLRGAGDPQAAADETVRLALDAGSRDNVTAAVADVVDGAADARPVRFAGAAAARFSEELDAAV